MKLENGRASNKQGRRNCTLTSNCEEVRNVLMGVFASPLHVLETGLHKKLSKQHIPPSPSLRFLDLSTALINNEEEEDVLS